MSCGWLKGSRRLFTERSSNQETSMSAVPDEVMKYVANAKDDEDPQETAEWLEALAGVISAVGPDRAHYLIQKQIEFARVHGEHLPFSANTPYINTIPVAARSKIQADQALHTRSARTRAGTPLPWCYARARTRTWAGISLRSRRRPRCMTSVSTISG